MDDRNDRRRGDRLSWREIDQLRDKSRERDRDPMTKRSSPASLNAQRSYRAALERAFAAGTLGELAKTLGKPSDPRPSGPPPAAPAAPAASDAAPSEQSSAIPAPPPAPLAAPKDPERENRQKLLAKIRESEGREPIIRAVDAYLARYPKLPDDFEILTKALAHRDDDRVRQTLEQLTALLAKEKPRRGRALAAQLRFLEDTHSDPEIRAAAASVRALL